MQYPNNRWLGQGGYREVLQMAIPLVLSTSAWSVQHFVDRMFLTWYSPEAIAAAMPAGILNFAIMSLFIGTASYVGTFVAQYYGAGQYNRIGTALWQGIYMSLIGALVLIFMIPTAPSIFGYFGHDVLVQKYEVEYFQILCLGAGPVIASSAIAGFFSGRGRPWPIMWVNTFGTAVNLVLDYALIFGKWGLPEMGIKGAAIATVLAGFISFALYMVLMSDKDQNQKYHTLRGWRFDKDAFGRLLRYGFPSGVQFFLDMAGFTLFVLIIGRLGTVSLAATNIAFNISTLAFMPMIGFGIAVSVLVGQYLGGNKPDLAQKSVFSGFYMTFAYMLCIAVTYVAVPQIFVAPFASQADPESFDEIYALTVILLRFVAVYSIFDTMNIIFASAIKGAGDTRFVMLMIILISSVVLVIPAYIAIVVFDYGIMAGWSIASTYVVVLGLSFFLRFRGGKWKAMRVIEEAPPVLPSTCAECPGVELQG